MNEKKNPKMTPFSFQLKMLQYLMKLERNCPSTIILLDIVQFYITVMLINGSVHSKTVIKDKGVIL